MCAVLRTISLVTCVLSFLKLDILDARYILSATPSFHCDPPSIRQSTKEINTIYLSEWQNISCNWTISIQDENSCLRISLRLHGNKGTHFMIVEGDDETVLQTKPGDEIDDILQNITVCNDVAVVLYGSNDSSVDDELYLSYSTVQDTRLLEYHLNRRANIQSNATQTTSPPKKNSPKEDGGPNGGIIAVGVIVPAILIAIGGCVFYIWYRKKYPVRMIVGKDFSKFSNPAYTKRASTATLVRNASDDDAFMHDIAEGMAAKGVSHDNPALTLEDESNYQPHYAGASLVVQDFEKHFDDSPVLERKRFDRRKDILRKSAALAEEEEKSKQSSSVSDTEDTNPTSAKLDTETKEADTEAISKTETQADSGQMHTNTTSSETEEISENKEPSGNDVELPQDELDPDDDKDEPSSEEVAIPSPKTQDDSKSDSGSSLHEIESDQQVSEIQTNIEHDESIEENSLLENSIPVQTEVEQTPLNDTASTSDAEEQVIERHLDHPDTHDGYDTANNGNVPSETDTVEEMPTITQENKVDNENKSENNDQETEHVDNDSSLEDDIITADEKLVSENDSFVQRPTMTQMLQDNDMAMSSDGEQKTFVQQQTENHESENVQEIEIQQQTENQGTYQSNNVSHSDTPTTEGNAITVNDTVDLDSGVNKNIGDMAMQFEHSRDTLMDEALSKATNESISESSVCDATMITEDATSDETVELINSNEINLEKRDDSGARIEVIADSEHLEPAFDVDFSANSTLQNPEVTESIFFESAMDEGFTQNVNQVTSQQFLVPGTLLDNVDSNDTQMFENQPDNASHHKSDMDQTIDESVGNDSGGNVATNEASNRTELLSNESFEIIDNVNDTHSSIDNHKNTQMFEEMLNLETTPPSVQLADGVDATKVTNQAWSILEPGGDTVLEASASSRKSSFSKDQSQKDSSSSSSFDSSIVNFEEKHGTESYFDTGKGNLEQEEEGHILSVSNSFLDKDENSANHSESSLDLSSSFEVIDERPESLYGPNPEKLSPTAISVENFAESIIENNGKEGETSHQELSFRPAVNEEDTPFVTIGTTGLSTEFGDFTNKATTSDRLQMTEAGEHFDNFYNDKGGNDNNSMSSDSSDFEIDEDLNDQVGRDERRESNTRKIEVGHISFDSSSSEADDDDEESVSTGGPAASTRGESITLDNPAFASPTVGLRLQFQPRDEAKSIDLTSPEGEGPLSSVYQRRKSITMDNPFFDEDGEPVSDVTESKLEDFHMIEASHIKEEDISTDSDTGSHGSDKNGSTSGDTQKKIVKVDLVSVSDDDNFDADDVSVNSDIPSIDSDVSSDASAQEIATYQVQVSSDDEYDV